MNIDYLSHVPVDVFIKQITYLPFDKVIDICSKTNKKLHSYCSDSKYNNQWKSLIDNTFKHIDKYDDKLKSIWTKLNVLDNTYNFLVYTGLVKLLDPIVQLEIYRRQGDDKSYQKTLSLVNFLKKIEYAERSGKVLDISSMRDDYTGIKMIWRPGIGSRKIGPEGLPIVSRDINKYEHIIKLLGPKYNMYLDQYKNLI